MPKCNGCGFTGEPDKFSPCISVYHDFRCPKCGTTDIDTSDINKKWAESGQKYGYKDGNTMDLSKS